MATLDSQMKGGHGDGEKSLREGATGREGQK